MPLTTPQGEAIGTTGLTVSACTPTPTAVVATTGCGASPNRSAGPQLTLAWTGPAALTVTPGAATRDISTFAALEFRTSENYTSAQQLATENILPVTLTDTTGGTKTLLSSDYSAALEPEPGTSARKQILNGVRIPLAAFTGVDLTSIRSIVLGVGTQTTTGSVQFTDLALQEPAVTIGPSLPEAPVAPLLLLGGLAVGAFAWRRVRRHPAPRTN